MLYFFLVADVVALAARNDAIRNTAQIFNSEASLESNERISKNRHRLRQRELNRYEFFDNAQTNTRTSLLDVWLCLALALGGSIWLVRTKQPRQEIAFEQEESAKAMGHVLQVSLGEDTLGTGIPVYYAVIDFVVEGDTDEEHMQVRKIFTSKKLIEEGFANVEVMYLVDDPTTAILMDDLLDQKKERDLESQSGTEYNGTIYFLSVLLVVFSLFGSVRMASRLETPLYGWISLAIGILLLYPSAKLLYRLVTHLYSLAGPLSDRPGIIVHGKRLYWKNQCHGTLNPMEILGIDNKNSDGSPSSKPKRSSILELSNLKIPSIKSTKGRAGLDQDETPKLFPNAGCGFENFNVHLPTGRPTRASSSVSSISASASQLSDKSSSTSKIVRNDTSILEKYELHVSSEQTGKK